MRRGDVVILSTKGPAAKPRPGIIIQATNLMRDDHHVLACPLTSHLVEGSIIRPMVAPSASNGLRRLSQVMVDRLSGTLPEDIGQTVGQIEDVDMRSISLC